MCEWSVKGLRVVGHFCRDTVGKYEVAFLIANFFCFFLFFL